MSFLDLIEKHLYYLRILPYDPLPFLSPNNINGLVITANLPFTYLTLMAGSLLFGIGLFGIIYNRRNIIIVLMSIELILLGVNYNFIAGSFYLNDYTGFFFVLLILTVAASESAIGLAILVAYYRVKGSIAIRFTNILK